MPQEGDGIIIQRNGAQQDGHTQGFGGQAHGATEYELIPNISLRKSTKMTKKETNKNKGHQVN